MGGRRILAELGSGGMGIVYKAHDLEFDDAVALKLPRPGALADAEQLERLKSEIRLARRITHPNVLRTFDFGDVGGRPYISMEYVRGLTKPENLILEQTGNAKLMDFGIARPLRRGAPDFTEPGTFVGTPN